MLPRRPGLSLLAILLVILLFGPRKLPDIAYALGKTVRAFINGVKE